MLDVDDNDNITTSIKFIVGSIFSATMNAWTLRYIHMENDAPSSLAWSLIEILCARYGVALLTHAIVAMDG